MIFLIFLQRIFFASCSISSTELNISLTLMKHLNVHQCILSADELDFSIFNVAKNLSPQISITYKSSEDLGFYIIADDWLYFKKGLRPCLYPWNMAVLWKTNVSTFNIRLDHVKIQRRSLLRQFHWILILESGDLNDIKIYISYDCLFFIIKKINETDYEILEMYNVGKFKMIPKKFIKIFGTWNKHTGLNVTDEYIYWRRKNFEREILTLYVGNNDLFTASPHLSKQWEFWHTIKMILNFTNLVVTYKDVKNIADITDNRIANYFDGNLNLQAWNPRFYTSYVIAPFWVHKVYMHVKYELDDMSDLQSLLRPFSTNVWIFVSSILILSSIFILIIEYLIIKMTNYHTMSKSFLLENLFTPLQLLLNQGGGLPQNFSSRAVNISLSILALILLPAYTGMVVSLLTLKKPNFPFKNLEGFMKNGRYKLNGVADSYIVSHFTYHQDENPLYKLLLHKYFVNSSEMVFTLGNGLDQICKGRKIALLSYNDEAFLDQYNQKIKCKILKIPEVIFTVTSAMSTSYLGGHQVILNHMWLRFRTVGIYQKMTKEVFRKIQEDPKDEFESIIVNQIVPAMSIFAVGIILSILILLCEFFWVCTKEKMNLKSTEKQMRNRSSRNDTRA